MDKKRFENSLGVDIHRLRFIKGKVDAILLYQKGSFIELTARKLRAES